MRAEGKRKRDTWFVARPMNIILFATTYHPENYLFHSRVTMLDEPGEKVSTKREERERARAIFFWTVLSRTSTDSLIATHNKHCTHEKTEPNLSSRVPEGLGA